ncbi:D-alanine--D-alanine ligase [Microbacterium sp. BG28]|uniref:D-alanine--D-alanine ligase family protein n=1 Tax=Microbacterium sp. BG28 TaxID=3097356 RepID=UPI002A59EE24|nr:D-alanine--D-alanine ligase [Microbacterium sp. BG28]MDY0829430.1 D-alanine--D-alanine ligase [Microbacterium sp. BG28]
MTTLRRRRVAVIGGGANDEHDVSLASAAAVARGARELGDDVCELTIERGGHWRCAEGSLTSGEAVRLLDGCDVVFPALHGVNGEDGAVAGLLTMLGVPFAGSPVRAGALAMDKWAMKLVAGALGVATAPGILIEPGDAMSVVPLAAPFVVKPTTGGSSNGVSLVSDASDLAVAIERARCAGNSVLVEPFITGREVDIAVFRGPAGALRVGEPLEIAVAERAVFDHAAKYDGSAPFIIPARVTSDELEVLERDAVRLYDALGCAGVARFDFFVTGRGVVLNEVNTTPGMTEHSQVPRMFAAVGLSYAALIDELLKAAVAR